MFRVLLLCLIDVERSEAGVSYGEDRNMCRHLLT